MDNWIFATRNEEKMREIREILGDLAMHIRSLRDAGVSQEVEETGSSFLENAILKATAIRDLTGSPVLADDSGLEIDALNKEPGIYSARYLGEDTPYDIKNRILLERMAQVPEAARTARFVCAIAAALPDGRVLTAQGVMEGRIAHAPAGENGFGYDPIFYLPQYGRTSAELAPAQKNAISHRGKALREMRDTLGQLL